MTLQQSHDFHSVIQRDVVRAIVTAAKHKIIGYPGVHPKQQLAVKTPSADGMYSSLHQAVEDCFFPRLIYNGLYYCPVLASFTAFRMQLPNSSTNSHS